MNIPNIDTILSRDKISSSIKTFLNNFENNKQDLLLKRGIYLYGHPGCGKTTFIKKLLKELNYDSLVYDAGDIRNKNVHNGSSLQLCNNSVYSCGTGPIVGPHKNPAARTKTFRPIYCNGKS